MSMMCSSQLMSCPSPVVPPTIRPPTPASICFSTSASYAARSTLPLGRYGVLIAVIRRVALISSTEAVVDFIVEFVHALDATHCGGGIGIARQRRDAEKEKRASPNRARADWGWATAHLGGHARVRASGTAAKRGGLGDGRLGGHGERHAARPPRGGADRSVAAFGSKSEKSQKSQKSQLFVTRSHPKAVAAFRA